MRTRPARTTASILTGVLASTVAMGVLAAPAHAVTAYEALTAAVAAPAAVLPDRIQVRMEQRQAGVTMRQESRSSVSAHVNHEVETYLYAGQEASSAREGYAGGRAYEDAHPGDLTAAQRQALAAAGRPGPYLLRAAPSAWNPAAVESVRDVAPISIATELLGTVGADQVQSAPLPKGGTLFRLMLTTPEAATVDFEVDAAGRFVHTWIEAATARVEFTLLAWGSAVDLGYPTGYSAVTQAEIDAAVAAYPRNVATVAVTAKAKNVAKRINKWAKKKHVAVTRAVVKKKAPKAISGYTVSRTRKGVKVGRAFVASPPAAAGTTYRCVVAKKGAAVARAC